jgi:hypothetical protein
MTEVFDWKSPSSRLVLDGVLDALAVLGLDGLTVEEVRTRAGAAGRAVDDSIDLESLVIVALDHVELFRPPVPSGDLQRDLRTLLEPWRSTSGRDERAVAAVLSAALRRPRLKVALYQALDRPLMQAVSTVVAAASEQGRIPPRLIQTLAWVLRGLVVDRLRSGPRSSIDIDLLIDFLIAGLGAGDSPGTRDDLASRHGPLLETSPG